MATVHTLTFGAFTIEVGRDPGRSLRCAARPYWWAAYRQRTAISGHIAQMGRAATPSEALASALRLCRNRAGAA